MKQVDGGGVEVRQRAQHDEQRVEPEAAEEDRTRDGGHRDNTIVEKERQTVESKN